ncbi:unnamed protein product [Prorocentrum cordatum]|uniref:Uncharacterized protein n=1 Tax=Prorocentrum cordatum TaxID=2364126 RepID=A0ABN9QEC1_9DINO|nr:unnamed protein product [Polarella glacialis]
MSDTTECTGGSVESEHIVYKYSAYPLLLMHGCLLTVLIVFGVRHICAKFRSLCMAIRFFSCDQVRCMTCFRCASGQNRKLEAQVKEVRNYYFFTFGRIHVVGQLIISVFCHISLASAEQSVQLHDGWRTKGMVNRYVDVAPMYISATAMMLMLGVLPKSTSMAWLNALNIMAALSVIFCSAVPDTIRGFPVPVGGSPFRAALMFQISQSCVCGNPKLSSVLLCFFVSLKAIQEYLCHSDLFTFVVLALYAVFTLIAFWSLDSVMRHMAAVYVREADATKQASLIERLMSKSCDACIYLGPRLEITKGAGQLCRLLMCKSDPESFNGRVFTEFATEDEKPRVSDFMTRPSEADDAERDTQAGLLSTKLRDTLGITVRVQIFHACLGSGDDLIHVIGINEEQDEWNTQRAYQSDLAAMGAEGAGHALDKLGPSPDGSERSESVDSFDDDDGVASGVAGTCDSEMHVAFDLFAGNGDDVLPITSCSPAFSFLFGSFEPRTPIRVLFTQSEYNILEKWVTDAVVAGPPDQHKAPRSKWLSFRLRKLNRLGVDVKAHCSLAPCGDDVGSMRLNLFDIQWLAVQQELPQAKPTARPRGRRNSGSRKSSLGTPSGLPARPLRNELQHL